jgi:hypothetical protein
MIKNLIERQKAALVMGVIAVASLAFMGVGNPRALIVMVGGLACVALLIGAYLLFQRASKRRKDRKADDSIRFSTKQPTAGADHQAELESLQRKFDSGIETLDSLGLSMNALPWIIIVGEPASGKSEAIRRCKIPFPQGLTDELQGTGGTVNMDWWFTEHAIILDTAGKMLFEEAGQAESSEWIRFLELIRKVRPRCPVNGMLLVIPADSLLADSDASIEESAKKIARQLTQIQRKLSVRFPVYVVVTKSDLIAGFREYFETLDERLHQQMLGWSNPDPLDEPFDPEKLERALAEIRDRLEHHRFQLLRDPVHTEDPDSRRLAQVDRLYDFPSAIEALGPRIRRYLEIVFAGGKLAPKPLFFRGIYFTSSIQKGSALDAVLAESLGMSVDQIKEAAPFERVRPLFLRDLFMEKVFEETGLVTHVDNTDKLKTRRRAILLGAGAALVALFFGFTAFQYVDFRTKIGEPRDNWMNVAGVLERGFLSQFIQVTQEGVNFQNDKAPEPLDVPVLDVAQRTAEWASTPLSVPVTLRLASGFQTNLGQEQWRAQRSLLAWLAVTPGVEEVRRQSGQGGAEVTAHMLRLHTLARGETPSGPAPGAETNRNELIALGPLYRHVLRKEFDANEPKISEIEALMQLAFPSGADADHVSLAARVALGRPVRESFDAEPVALVERLVARAGQDDEAEQARSVYDLIEVIWSALNQFRDADLGLMAVYGADQQGVSVTGADATWRAQLNSLMDAKDRIDAAVKELIESHGFARDDVASAESLKDAYSARRSMLLSQLPAAPLESDKDNPLDRARDVILAQYQDLSDPTVLSGDGAEGPMAAWYFTRFDPSEDARAYSVIADMFAAANAVDSAPDLAQSGPLSIDGFFDEVVKLGGACDGAVDKIDALERKDAQQLSARADAARMRLGWAAADWRTRAIVGTFENARSDAAVIEGAVTRIVQVDESAQSGLAFPELDLASGLSPGRVAIVNPAYHPSGVSELTDHCWAGLVQTPPESGPGAYLEGVPGFPASKRNLEDIFDAYAEVYATYWSQTVPGLADVEFADAQTWAEVIAEFSGGVKIEDALVSLTELNTVIDVARKALPDGVLTTLADGDPFVRMPRRFLSDDEETEDKLRASVNFWVEKDDAVEMRKTLIAIKTKDELLKSTLGDLNLADDVIYWQSLYVSLFEKLGDELDEERKAVLRDYGGFPLLIDDDRQLDASEVAQAAAKLKDMQTESAPATNVEEVDEAIRAVFETGTTIDKMRRIAEAIDAGATVRLFNIKRPEQSRSPSGGSTRVATDEWDRIRCTLPTGVSPLDENARPPTNDPLGEFSLKEPKSLDIELYAQNDNTNRAELSIAGPWAGIRLLQWPGAEPYENGTYRVPLIFTNSQGQHFHYWIGLELDTNNPNTEFPKPDAWPPPAP